MKLTAQLAGERAGYALIIVMMMAGVSLLILSGTASRTINNMRLNDRSNVLLGARSAAEAATEKTLARMMVDFQQGGQGQIIANLNSYGTDIPNTTENAYWANFTFQDARGNANQTYAVRTTTNSNPPYVQLRNHMPA